MTAKSGGESQLIENMRISWGIMMRSSLGLEAFRRADSISPEGLGAELEEASHIRDLERRYISLLNK